MTGNIWEDRLINNFQKTIFSPNLETQDTEIEIDPHSLVEIERIYFSLELNEIAVNVNALD